MKYMKKITASGLALTAALGLFGRGDGEYTSSDIFKSMAKGDKLAVLTVHFGTTHDDTRALTVDALNRQVQSAFPDVECREAYTSRIVARRLRERGIAKSLPTEALSALHADGYTHILIQPSTVIDGIEMEALQRDAEEAKSLFKDIRIGRPLLYSPDDYERVIEALTENSRNDRIYVWVGHGTRDAATAQYAMLDYMLKAKGYKNRFVATLEGYPDYETALAQIKLAGMKSGLKKIELQAFMFVYGDHAKNDIAGEWKTRLEKEGFDVETVPEGLGQNSKIRDIYVAHLKFVAAHRKTGIVEKKKIYESTGKKGNVQ
jgi:sirohydrochlorin cobaltochelatase